MCVLPPVEELGIVWKREEFKPTLTAARNTVSAAKARENYPSRKCLRVLLQAEMRMNGLKTYDSSAISFTVNVTFSNETLIKCRSICENISGQEE